MQLNKIHTLNSGFFSQLSRNENSKRIMKADIASGGGGVVTISPHASALSCISF